MYINGVTNCFINLVNNIFSNKSLLIFINTVLYQVLQAGGMADC